MHALWNAARAVLGACLLLGLDVDPAPAQLERKLQNVGGRIHQYDIKAIRIHKKYFGYYLVGFIDSDHRLKLSIFWVGSNQHVTWVRRLEHGGPGKYAYNAGARTGGAAYQFDMAENAEILLTAYQDREQEFRVTTWDLSFESNKIRRLDDWEGERIYRVSTVFLREIDGFQRFVTAVADANRNQRIDVWDVEPGSGRIHKRGHAVGGRVGELSLAALRVSHIDLDTPAMIVTVATDADNDLWTRVWKIDRAGNVSQGAGRGDGRAYRVGVVGLMSDGKILASVRESQGRLKMIAFRIGDQGNSIARLRDDHLTEHMVHELAACDVWLRREEAPITAVTNASGELRLHRWRMSDFGVQLSDTNNEGGTTDRIACAGDDQHFIAAVRDSAHNLRVIFYMYK